MGQAEIQALLDPTTTGRGTLIIRSMVAGLKTTWYVLGGMTYVGKAKLIDTTTADSDADQATAINSAMAL